MDKKAKKRIEVLRKKIDKMQLLLHDAKAQLDDPDEVAKLEADLEAARSEISELKES